MPVRESVWVFDDPVQERRHFAHSNFVVLVYALRLKNVLSLPPGAEHDEIRPLTLT